MIHFVVHEQNDGVGVVVVEGVKAGQELSGWIMEEDKDLKVVAKNDIVLAQLAGQFSRRTIVREYQAIIWGRLAPARGTVDAALGRSKSDRKKFAVSGSGKEASTDYEVIEEFAYLSLVKLRLRTGRTHQIRVHMHHIGHPVFGDPTYGGRRIAWGTVTERKREEVRRYLGMIGRQALHARTIGFYHPAMKKMMTFDSNLPPDMSALLDDLRAGRAD